MLALITGAAGQLGVELVKSAPQNVKVVGLTHAHCDISDAAAIEQAVTAHKPDVVINAAAYTAVDEAESHRDLAHRVNAVGAGNVARAAEAVGARTIHVSTDYVFDGVSRNPYRPDSATNPINIYGRSKEAGEKNVQSSSSNHLIVRSSWLYSTHGKNFLLTMLSLMRGAKPVRVVCDQFGTPTSARHLARVIWKCAGRPELRGIRHWVNGGSGSWFDFAQAIQRLMLESGLVDTPAPVSAVTSTEYGALAKRPAFSVLDATQLEDELGEAAMDWRVALAETLANRGTTSPKSAN